MGAKTPPNKLTIYDWSLKMISPCVILIHSCNVNYHIFIVYQWGRGGHLIYTNVAYANGPSVNRNFMIELNCEKLF
jgi:hypothetical protein